MAHIIGIPGSICDVGICRNQLIAAWLAAPAFGGKRQESSEDELAAAAPDSDSPAVPKLPRSGARPRGSMVSWSTPNNDIEQTAGTAASCPAGQPSRSAEYSKK